MLFPAVTVCNMNKLRRSAINTSDAYKSLLDLDASVQQTVNALYGDYELNYLGGGFDFKYSSYYNYSDVYSSLSSWWGDISEFATFQVILYA